MAVKDYIGIALLLLAAYIFYRRGYRSGVLQTRKVWKSLLEKTVSVPQLPPQPPPETAPPHPRVLVRGQRAFFTTSAIDGDFGKN